MWVHCARKTIKSNICESLISHTDMRERREQETKDKHAGVWIYIDLENTLPTTERTSASGSQTHRSSRNLGKPAEARNLGVYHQNSQNRTQSDNILRSNPSPTPPNLFHFSVLHNTRSANKWMENIWKTHKGISTGMRHWSRRLLGRSVKIWRCITCVRNKGPQGCEYMVGVGIAFVLRAHFHVLFSFTVITWKSAGTTTSTKTCVFTVLPQYIQGDNRSLEHTFIK